MAEQRSSPGSGRKPIKSQKLDRTLQELESAFVDWESLNTNKTRPPAAEEPRRATEPAANEQEFVQRTKQLLSQLREQLAELND